MDYVMAALQGFNGDYYVPGSFQCVNKSRFVQLDTITIYNKINIL